MRKTSYAFKQSNPVIQEIARAHHNDPLAIIEMLQDVQAKEGTLTQETIQDVAYILRIPEEKVQGIATFYTLLSTDPSGVPVIRICDGPVCWLAGAQEIIDLFKAKFPSLKIERNSCLGLCDRAPAGLVHMQQAGPINIEALKKAGELEQGSLLDTLKNTRGLDYSFSRPGETRVMLENIGKINPHSIASARQYGAYQALEKTLQQPLAPETIIDEVKKSGIRGRGGAGFPVGTKWGFVAAERRTPKYVVCNADESEPLVFKDRILIENKPHQVLEGMILGGYATGAAEGYIYIRGEYVRQADLLEEAIEQATQAGLLGENILGSGFSFKIHVHRGAGAYICGEETALLESLEGKRGEPRIRPPYPTVNGYRGMPTLVNNVETFAAVPAVITHGSEWYTHRGESSTPGTKIFALLGAINQPGAFEATYGYTLRQLIDQFGGGMKPGSTFHFALCGGAAGTIIPEHLLDVPLDYESWRKGVSLGAGAFLICDQNTSPLALVRELMYFFEMESCGKCTPCRVGTHLVRELLDDLLAGNEIADPISRLTTLAKFLQNDSFCGLGQSTAMPLLSAIEHFPGYFSGKAS